MDTHPPIVPPGKVRWLGGRAWNGFIRATINSWHGLVACAKSEAAFREELALLAVGIPLAFVITGDTGERFALIGVSSSC